MSLLLAVTGVPAAYTLSADPGTYSVTGQSATLVAAYNLNAESGTYSVTGNAATLNASYNLISSSGNYSVTGSDVALTARYELNAGSNSYSITGSSATVTASYNLSADAGSYSVTGVDAILIYVPAVPAAKSSGVRRLFYHSLRPNNPPAPYISIDWSRKNDSQETVPEPVKRSVPSVVDKEIVEDTLKESTVPLESTSTLMTLSGMEGRLQAEVLQLKQTDQYRLKAMILLLMAA